MRFQDFRTNFRLQQRFHGSCAIKSSVCASECLQCFCAFVREARVPSRVSFVRACGKCHQEFRLGIGVFICARMRIASVTQTHQKLGIWTLSLWTVITHCILCVIIHVHSWRFRVLETRQNIQVCSAWLRQRQVLREEWRQFDEQHVQAKREEKECIREYLHTPCYCSVLNEYICYHGNATPTRKQAL